MILKHRNIFHIFYHKKILYFPKYNRFHGTSQKIYTNLDSLDDDQIIFLLQQFSRSRLNEQTIWQRLCMKLSPNLYEFNFDRIKSILHSVSRINHFHFAFTNKLVKCILTQSVIDSRSLTQILLDLKALQYLHSNVFNCLVNKHITSATKVDFFDAIMLLHLASHVRVRDLSFINKIIDVIESNGVFEKIMFDTGLVSSVIRSLASLDISHPIFDKFVKSSASLLYKFNPQELSNIAFSIIMQSNSRQMPLHEFIKTESFEIFVMLCKMCHKNLHKMVHIEINQLRTVGWYLFPKQTKSNDDTIQLFSQELNELKDFFNETMQVKLDFKPNPSKLQRTVTKLIGELGLDFAEEYPLGPYLIDLVLPKHRIAIEVNGFSHFYDQTILHTSKTRLKYSIVQRMGWKIAEINHHQWKNINRTDRLRILQRTLKPLLAYN